MQGTEWNKRMLGSTRGKIVALLRVDNRTVNELAAELRLTPNAVRAHLLKLEGDGLVQQHGTRRGTRKPHVAYALGAQAEQIFPKAYGILLNHLLVAMSRRLTARELRAAMQEVGKALAQEHLDRVKGRSRRERIEIALALYHELGGSAVFNREEGKDFILGRDGCPLSAVTLLHHGACAIMQSFLSKVIGVQIKCCCKYGQVARCGFEIQR